MVNRCAAMQRSQRWAWALKEERGHSCPPSHTTRRIRDKPNAPSTAAAPLPAPTGLHPIAKGWPRSRGLPWYRSGGDPARIQDTVGGHGQQMCCDAKNTKVGVGLERGAWTLLSPIPHYAAIPRQTKRSLHRCSPAPCPNGAASHTMRRSRDKPGIPFTAAAPFPAPKGLHPIAKGWPRSRGLPW